MNKLIATIIILIGFVHVSSAQIYFKDSTEAYNYWTKRGIIEVVYAYMQDYITQSKTDTTKILTQSEEDGKNNYHQKFIKNINTANQLPDKETILAFLQENSWSGTKTKVFVPLMKKYDEGSPLEIDFFDKLDRPRYNNTIYWNLKTKSIIERYENALLEFDIEEVKVEESKTELILNLDNNHVRPERPPQEEDEKQIPWDRILWHGSFFIVGILIGGWMIFLITKRKIKSIVNEDSERKYDDYLYAPNDSTFLFGYLSVVSYLNKQKDKYKKENESVSKHNGELERKISKLEKDNKDFSDKNIELGKKRNQKPIQNNEGKAENHNAKSESFVNQPTKKITKIYFSMPESDGSFQLSNGETSNDGKKYFKIEFEESSTKGELFYLSGERDQRAINRLESYLKPVCDIENITNSSTATKIELIHTGIVSHLNDSWIIDPENKIKIKLY